MSALPMCGVGEKPNLVASKNPPQPPPKGGDPMKKLSVRSLETVKTTAALYGGHGCPVIRLG